MQDRDRITERIDQIWEWMRQERSLTCAGFGIFLFLLGFFCGHLDERIRFALDALAFLAFGAAVILERQATARMVWILLLAGSLMFVQMDYRLSTHLSQARSNKTFEAR